MSGDQELDDMLGPDPVAELQENLVEVAPPGYRPMGEAGRALLERSRSYPINRAKKNTPEKLKRALDYIAEMPVATDTARRLGISFGTLKYWLQKSKEGVSGDGFDVVLGENDENGTDDNTMRFHEAWDDYMMAGVENVEAATIRRATGFDEVLTYQGRVQYKYDPIKVAESLELGLPEFVPQNYLLDRFGAPVPETVYKMDPDLAMFVLKSRKPQVYGAKASVDLNVKGGVLVVGMRAASSAALNEIEADYRKEGRPAVTFEEKDEDE